MMMKLGSVLLLLSSLTAAVLAASQQPQNVDKLRAATAADLEETPQLQEILNRALQQDEEGNYYNQQAQGNQEYNGDGKSGPYGTNFFAESQNTEYGGYQQAWRYLGWYVKCGYPSDRYNGGGSHEGSHDKQGLSGNNWCQRYLVWASVSSLSSLFCFLT